MIFFFGGLTFGFTKIFLKSFIILNYENVFQMILISLRTAREFSINMRQIYIQCTKLISANIGKIHFGLLK